MGTLLGAISHLNTRKCFLSTIDKFNYLETVLVGRAAETLAGLTPTEDSYNSAIVVLKDEYGNHEKIIDHTMQRLLSTQPVSSKTDAHGLRLLYTSVLTSTRSLTSLGVPSSHYFVMLKGVLFRCLPNELRVDFHRFYSNLADHLDEGNRENNCNIDEPVIVSSASDISSTKSIGDKQVRSLLKFLKREVEALETANEAKSNSKHQHGHHQHKVTTSKPIKTAVGLFTAGNKENVCFFCKGERHATKDCDCGSSLSEKKQLLKTDGRCFRCCRKGHNSKMCRITNIACKSCNGRHATTMCDPSYAVTKKKSSLSDNAHDDVITTAPASSSSKQPAYASSPQQTMNLYTTHAHQQISNVYLQTACAFISNTNFNGELFVRVVLDGGSQMSFVKTSVARRLNLPSIGSHNLSLIPFGCDKPKPNKLCNKVRFYLRSQYNNQTVVVDAIEVPEICFDVLAVPNNDIESSMKGLSLADARVSGQAPEQGISILIGADSYWQFATGNLKRITNKLTAIDTVLGWTIQCPFFVGPFKSLENCFTSLSICACEDIRNFWQLETLGILPPSYKTVSKDLTMNIYRSGNRFEVSLPWKKMSGFLHSNYSGAIQRMKSLVRKLCSTERMLEYDAAMREMLLNEVAEPVPEKDNNQERIYYLPHRPVYREDKDTTKLRIVFDASAHTPNYTSLNDHLEVGDNMLPDVLTILLNFRVGKIALTADIEKAFLQILLNQNDRDSHRFLWFAEPLSDIKDLPAIKTYRMTRVTFGVTCSPFLLGATIHKAIEEANRQYPQTCNLLRTSFYMDDLVLSVDNESTALNIYKEADIILKGASMTLRKWNTNSLTVRRQFAEEQRLSQTRKVLGVRWVTSTDELIVDLDGVSSLINSEDIRATKRNVLKVMAKIFDPLGFLGPWTVRLKILFQSIWRKKFDWDETLPDDMLKVWIICCKEISELKDMAIPRHVFIGQDNVQIHVFADASQHAFGAVAYARCCDINGNIFVRFICSKNRVAPLNSRNQNELTIPKLELTAALVAVRLLDYLRTKLRVQLNGEYLWTDSKIAWFWISGSEKRWKPYIENRVREIRSLSDVSNWRHCPGSNNPADLVTRGISAASLLSSSLWITGPDWLKDDPFKWPTSDKINDAAFSACLTCGNTSELDHTPELTSINNKQPINCEEFSDWNRLLRVTAYFLRAVNCFKTKTTFPPLLSAEDINRAEQYWISNVQLLYFPNEIAALRQRKGIPSNSNLLTLTPFLDELHGLLRVGGRLQFTNLETCEAHPLILPKSSHVTKLIVVDAHAKLFHGGINAVVSQLRSKFWVIKARQLVKTIIKNCIVCKVLRAKPASQPFAPLPRDRVFSSRPFEVTGIDFAGPLYISDNANQRKKAYIMLLTCAAVRAVHLEVVWDLTTESCLLALRRFIAKRGAPHIIYSDNAKTFKKASSELNKIFDLSDCESFQGFLSNHRIKWKFIVERAPWWGGFWERLVGVVKSSLRAAIDRAILNADQLITLLSEVESVVNSRPLTYSSDNPADLAPLTPAHFLHITQAYPSFFLNERNLQFPTGKHLRKQWLERLRLISTFKKRWFREYLQQLRFLHHAKPVRATSISPGDVVLLQESSLPRTLWQLAIIQKVFPGRDGKVRACEVRLSNGSILRRPVQLLYPLEISN